jgi:hypothetical protein
MTEIRITEAPLDHGTASLVAALLTRLGERSVTLDAAEMGPEDVEVRARWDYAGGTVTLERVR